MARARDYRRDLFRREAELFVPRDLLDGWDRGEVDDRELLAYVCGTIPTYDKWVMADNTAFGFESEVPIAQRLLAAYRVVRLIERRDKERRPL